MGCLFRVSQVRIQVLNELGSFQKALRKLPASKILNVNRVQLFVVVGLRFLAVGKGPARLLEASFRSLRVIPPFCKLHAEASRGLCPAFSSTLWLPLWAKLEKTLFFKAKGPNLLGARYQFCGRKVFHGLRVEGVVVVLGKIQMGLVLLSYENPVPPLIWQEAELRW